MTAQNPIVNAGTKYVYGLQIARLTNTTMSMAAGAARDSGNTNDIVASLALTLNAAVIGANGIDAGALAASSMYAVYVIGDSTKYNATAAILSLSASLPNMPRGYDMYRRVGWVLTDASSHILQFWQYGEGEDRMYYYDVLITELSGGAATTFTAIDLATSVPAEATEVLFSYLFTPDGAGEIAEFLPFGSVATAGMIQIGTGVAAAQRGMVTVPCQLDVGVPKILYKVAAGDTLTLQTAGFKDLLS